GDRGPAGPWRSVPYLSGGGAGSGTRADRRPGRQGSAGLAIPHDRLGVSVGRVATGTPDGVDRARSTVVRQQGETQVSAIALDQVPQVPESETQIGFRLEESIMGDAGREGLRGARHDLRQPYGTLRADRRRGESALDTDELERQPGVESFGERNVVDRSGETGRDAVPCR